MRKYFAELSGADFTEPIAAGIFVSIVAWADYQRSEDETPYWRTLKANGELNAKYPNGIEAQKEKLEVVSEASFMGLFDWIKKKHNFEDENTIHSSVITDGEAIIVKDNFSYFGNGRCARPIDELEKVDKQEADGAYNKYKKEILDVFMKGNGFSKYKTKAYIRLNKIGLIEYVDLQKEVHGSRTFTLNVCLIPIYVPHEYLTIGFGDRIGCLINDKDFWWDYKDMETAKMSFENISLAIRQFVFPWFEKYTDEKHYREALLSHMGTIGISRIEWMTYLFIKNNEIELAENYLNDYLESEEFQNKIEIRQKHTNEVIKKLKTVLNSSNTNEEIINNAILYNAEKYKFPQKIISQKLG